jgi:hypothetical protein
MVCLMEQTPVGGSRTLGRSDNTIETLGAPAGDTGSCARIATPTKESVTIMNRVTIATALSLALTGASLLGAAPGQAAPGQDPKVGTRITITGCLHKGTSRDSFVLMGVTERPADSSEPGLPVPYIIYWLDSTDGLKARVGELVDVTGKVTARMSKPGTITIFIDPAESLSTAVKVTSGSKNATTRKFDDGPLPTGTTGSSSSLEMTRPVYKLAVDKVRSVDVPAAGPACR